jgi:hypothetical protein
LKFPATYFIFGSSRHFGRRKPMARKSTIETWKELAEAARKEAERLPFGPERKARQLETASQVNQWLSSPGLAPPS